MKKITRHFLLALTLAAAGSANALSFNTIAGASFTESFVVTPTTANSLVLSVSGLTAQYSALSFEILSGGPLVSTRTVGDSLMATFNDPRNENFSLGADTAYHLQISGTTRANLTGGYGLISITSLNGTVTTAPALAAITPVPEPETFAMLLAGLGVIGAFARRRNRPISPNGL